MRMSMWSVGAGVCLCKAHACAECIHCSPLQQQRFNLLRGEIGARGQTAMHTERGLADVLEQRLANVCICKQKNTPTQ